MSSNFLYWVEFKSWRFNPEYLKSSNGELQKSKFPLWDGVKKGDQQKTYTANAHRQHFLDYAASLDTLEDDYWKGKDFNLQNLQGHTL